MTPPRILPSGDTALVVEFGRRIDPVVNRQVLALDREVAREAVTGVTETVPTYRSLLVHYDPLRIDFATLSEKLLTLAQRPVPAQAVIRRWRVPVVYGGEHGIDLDDVARAHNISTSEVIAKHTGGDYRVAMIGFTPGFAYLGGLDPTIATPRRETPRTETPPGTISIGGVQACVQCLAAPSGWHLLGRTPVRTFHPHRDPVFLMEPGDAVTFHAIKANEFASLDRAAEQGEAVAELIAS
ncbi:MULTISPECIES: 5-oxoprolinase subunit PxpB [unclassified Afipia]|uniref:5-oxoprolinase subunit PxpB n=1 Tax=unclassified Afipia TaxID=2642050 RepID=UPI0004674DB5|nr:MULTISPECIES: 5-oxoprolinase subunit PxpB [unclassified Afipia]